MTCASLVSPALVKMKDTSAIFSMSEEVVNNFASYSNEIRTAFDHDTSNIKR